MAEATNNATSDDDTDRVPPIQGQPVEPAIQAVPDDTTSSAEDEEDEPSSDAGDTGPAETQDTDSPDVEPAETVDEEESPNEGNSGDTSTDGSSDDEGEEEDVDEELDAIESSSDDDDPESPGGAAVSSDDKDGPAADSTPDETHREQSHSPTNADSLEDEVTDAGEPAEEDTDDPADREGEANDSPGTEPTGEVQASDDSTAEPRNGEEDSALQGIDCDVERPPSRFVATIEPCDFDPVIDSLQSLVDEAKFIITSDSLVVQAVDPATVGVTEVTLDDTAFEAYGTDGGAFGVDLNRLESILGMADSSTDVAFELDVQTRKLEVVVGDIEYTLALIDPSAIREAPDIPDLGLESEVVLEYSEFNRGIRGADMVASSVTVGTDEDRFYMKASGDTDDVILEREPDELEAFSGVPAQATFSLDYVKGLRKGVPGKRTLIRLALGDSQPLKMQFEFAGGAGQVLYMLAPRVSSN